MRGWLLVVLLPLLACGGPRVDSFTPTFGPPGAEVTVRGQRLSTDDPAGTTVRIDTIDQPDRNASFDQVRFRVAEGSRTGQITIGTPIGSGTSAKQFEVVDAKDDPDGSDTFGGTD